MFFEKPIGNKRFIRKNWETYFRVIILLFFSSLRLTGMGQGKGNVQSLPSGILPMPSIIFYTGIPAYYNPSAYYSKYKFSVNSKVASYTGIRRDIKEYYFDTWYQFKKEAGFAIGMQIYDNQQGPYIQLLDWKIVPKYSWSISSTTQVSTALAVGLLNYAFKGNDFIAGGSDIAPDVDFGASIRSAEWRFGGAVKHLINQPLNPIVAEFRKNEIVNINGSRKLNLGPDFSIQPTLLLNMNLPYHRNYIDFTLEGVYKNYFQIAALLYHHNTLGLGAGLVEMPSSIGVFSLNFMFSKSFSQLSAVGSNRYEIGLSYKISKTDKIKTKQEN